MRFVPLRRVLLGALAASVFAPMMVQAQAPAAVTPIKFVLDWKLQGIHAWYFLALDKGYFAQEKIDLTIDQGDGSANAVTKVMAGTYQASFGDVNAIVQAAATRPELAPVMVYMLYNTAPFAIMTKASSNIRTVKDLQGKTIGTPAGGAAYKMFSVLAEKNGIDPSKVTWTNMAPNLQEQMLLRDQVEASAVFTVTSYMNLVAQNVDPDKDIRWINYSENGIDLYGNGVLVSRQLVKEKPQVVAGLVRAINKGVRDAIANPDAAIEALAKREPLINKDLEKRRLMYALKNVVLTPEAMKNGVGDVNDERFARSIDQLAKAFELTAKPAAKDVFDRSFLPPLAERQFSVK